MSEVTQPLMAEYKESAESLPTYRIDDTDQELVVGKSAQAKSCFGRRFFRCTQPTNGEDGGRRSRCIKSKRRAFIWIFSFLGLLTMIGMFAMHKCHSGFAHAIECSPITELTTTLTLPLASEKTRVFLHGSLTTGDSHIIHSGDVQNGTIKVSFTLPDGTLVTDDEDDKPTLFVCKAAKDRFVGVGIHDSRKGEQTPKVVFTTVTLPEGARMPPMILPGPKERGHRFMHKMIMKAIHKAEKKAIAEQRWAEDDMGDWEVVDA